MSKKFIEKTIQIQAPPSKVWAVFTNPKITRELGGEYVSEWKKGDSLRWRNLEGELLTNGEIIEIHVNKILKHNIFNLENTLASSVITYKFEDKNQNTILSIREDFISSISEEVYNAVDEGWEAALQAIKVLAERN